MILEIQNSSIIYTRWGKKTCPSNAEQVLSGNKDVYTYFITAILFHNLRIIMKSHTGLFLDFYES